MKIWYKILWIAAGIVPYAVIAIALQYAESSFFLLLQCSLWYLMLWFAASFIMQLVDIGKKYGRKKALRWLIAVFLLYGLLLLLAWTILHLS